MYSMSIFGPGTVLEQLDAGLTARTRIDTQFQLNLFNRILQLLRELENCPAAVAALPPGTAGALPITQAELTDFITRLSTPDNMDAAAVEDMVEPIARIGRRGDRSLRRTPGATISGPVYAIPRAPRSGSPASGDPGSSPASSGWSRYMPSWGRPSPRSDGSSGSVDLTRSGAIDSAIASSITGVDDFRRPPHTLRRSSIGDDELEFEEPRGLDALYRRGGRKTRRARKYRNRT